MDLIQVFSTNSTAPLEAQAFVYGFNLVFSAISVFIPFFIGYFAIIGVLVSGGKRY